MLLPLKKSRFADKLIILAIIVTTLCVSASNLLFPENHYFHASTYTITLLGKFLCYALLALSLDLVWGYLGFLSLGHGAFFALGGYAMGMYLMRQIGERGVYGNPELPDFMVFLDWQSLPWYWSGSDSILFVIVCALLIPGLLAYVVGGLAFRSRVSGVYFAIITQAMTYALMLAFFRNEMGFGGNNGLTDFKEILGFNIQSSNTRIVLLICSAIALIGGYLLCRSILDSKLGKVCLAIRDAEDRTRFLGYNVTRFKLVIFIISAMLAGIAGALYVPQVGIINPGEFSPIKSIEIVIWVAIGGRGSLYGAIIGALIVSFSKTVLTGVLPELWLFALGGLFVLVTLYLPKGIAGFLNKTASIHDAQKQNKNRSKAENNV